MHRFSKSQTTRLQPGSIIGLRDESPFAIVEQLREGVAFHGILKLSKASGFSVGRIASFMKIPPRTLVRRKARRLFTPGESERLLRLARLFEKSLQLFEGDAVSAREWLESPRAVLTGKSPIEFGETEVGAREVEQLIGRLEHGVFS